MALFDAGSCTRARSAALTLSSVFFHFHHFIGVR